MVQTSKGRPSGEDKTLSKALTLYGIAYSRLGRAFVDFFSSNDQTEALKRHKDYMGKSRE